MWYSTLTECWRDDHCWPTDCRQTQALESQLKQAIPKGSVALEEVEELRNKYVLPNHGHVGVIAPAIVRGVVHV